MTEEQEGQPAPPPEHPQPRVWWRHIRWQSWVSLLGMLAQAPSLIVWGIPDAATAPLVVINIGLVAGFSAYGGGSTLIDAIRAYRSPDDGR